MPKPLEENVAARLYELCLRSEKLGAPVFTKFMSPPEAAQAQRIAKERRMGASINGGYPDAERVIACFHPLGEAPDFPIDCLRITWDTRYGQADHRALLGSVLALGIERSLVGDIVLQEEAAYLLAAREMAPFISDNLQSAGRVSVKATVLDRIPPLSPKEGKVFRETVASLRLDAVLAAGLNLSRARASALITGGQAQVNHHLELRTDAQLKEGDLLSIRGFGRLRLNAVGQPTRKDRIPILFEGHGVHS
jgi:RNA-binding protein YlmH